MQGFGRGEGKGRGGPWHGWVKDRDLGWHGQTRYVEGCLSADKLGVVGGGWVWGHRGLGVEKGTWRTYSWCMHIATWCTLQHIRSPIASAFSGAALRPDALMLALV